MKNYQGLINPYPIRFINTFLSRIRYQIMIFKILCIFLVIGSFQLQAKSFSQQLSYKNLNKIVLLQKKTKMKNQNLMAKNKLPMCQVFNKFYASFP